MAAGIGALLQHCARGRMVIDHLPCERQDPRTSGALQGKLARLDFECIARAGHAYERHCIDALLRGSGLGNNKGE
jgi:hypothetical protein